jgi:hypothetical protein
MTPPRAKRGARACSLPRARARRAAAACRQAAADRLGEVVGRIICSVRRRAHALARHPHAGLARLLGPPGTGKTTVARLLAQATDLHFEQISAIFSGVADLKKVFDAARARRETGQGTLLFVDEIHRFNRASRIPSCRSWRTAPSCWSAPPRRIRRSS